MIGVADNESFQAELDRLTNKTSDKKIDVLPSNEKVVDINRGRTEGRTEISQEARAFISGEVLSGARANDVAKAFGVSESSISAYKKDATSTSSYHKPDKELSELNDASRRRIVGPAQQTLIDAIEAITPEKLNGSKVNVASAVARDMSSIIKNMQPDAGSTVNNNQVIIYKPRMKEEDDYIEMQVNE